MPRVNCPICGCAASLVGADVIETHVDPSRPIGDGPHRAGRYCDSTGYTLEQAQRWSVLPLDDRRVLLAKPNGALS